MKGCCGVELRLRSFLTPTQCYVEVNGQICYPATLTVGKEIPIPIGFEAGVKGSVAGWGELWSRHGEQSRNGGKFGGQMNI